MTIAEFKNELLKGHGRCYIELKKSTIKYQKVILWACTHSISWDAQCDGTHSYFLYSLISCYSDKKIFLDLIINKFTKLRENYWLFVYLSEILNYFYISGVEEAGKVLDLKYKEIYFCLLNLKSVKKDLNTYKLNCYEHLCVLKCRKEKDFVKIATDIDYLMQKKPLLNDFVWFISKFGSKYEKKLTGINDKNHSLTYFYQKYENYKEERKKFQSKHKNSKQEIEQTTKNVVLKAQESYAKSKTNEEKIKALQTFCFFSYTFEPTQIMQDAESENLELKETALKVLEKCRNHKVRKWILPKLDKDLYSYLPIYLRNYKAKDLPIILNLLNKIEFDFNNDGRWHKVISAILGMEDFMTIPKDLLYFVYEKSYCGTCRESAFRRLKRRHLLTQQIIEECNYDANSNIFY